jgi:FlaG/FlaF family flagellin (archaellin)
MKKLVAIAVILTGFAVSQSFGQGASTTGPVTLKVNAGLSVALENSGLSFGTHLKGDAVTVSDLTSSSAAYFSIGGQASTPVTVTLSDDNSMNLKNGSNLIPWSMTFAYSNNSAPAQTNATDVTSGGSPFTYSLNTSGVMDVWVGGSLTVPSGAVTGQYSDNVDISVTY